VLQHARETYQRRKEQANLRHKEWLAANPHKRREHEAARRAKSGKDRYTAADVDELLKIQRSRCAYCKCSIKAKFHVDHIMPLSKGGTNGRRNIQLLCQPCNQAKHARHPIDFANSLGMLV
jgi:5-methylcytosine-specific restriction endonuclease McrA